MGEVKFTNHAREKLEILKRYGFEITPKQVEETLFMPEVVISQSGGKFIAQRGISE